VSVRRCVLAYRQAVDPLSSLDAFDHFVGSYAELGIGEFIFYWPPIANLRERREISPQACCGGADCQRAAGSAQDRRTQTVGFGLQAPAFRGHCPVPDAP
jgi:hypothetical protein